MNSDLTKRLNDLKKDIIHPEGMQVTQSQNYPFSIFVYSPEEEFIMRAKFQELILDIKKKDIQILEINLAHECIELAKNRRFLRQVGQAQARALVNGLALHRNPVDADLD